MAICNVSLLSWPRKMYTQHSLILHFSQIMQQRTVSSNSDYLQESWTTDHVIWIADVKIKECMFCHSKFSPFRRKVSVLVTRCKHSCTLRCMKLTCLPSGCPRAQWLIGALITGHLMYNPNCTYSQHMACALADLMQSMTQSFQAFS